MDKLIILDIAIPQFLNNRVLDTSYAAKFPGASIYPYLRELAAKDGWDIMTADVFLKEKIKFSKAVCISNERTPFFNDLLKRQVRPGILISGELPPGTWGFYHKLRSYSRPYNYAFVFRGFFPRLSTSTQPYTFFWPCHEDRMRIGPPWSKRKLLGMVASYKQQVGRNRARLLSRLAVAPRWLRIKYYKFTDTMLRFPDLYEVRMSVIRAFSSNNEFQLFGAGWTEAKKYSKELRGASIAAFPLEYQQKCETLSNFKFSIAFESCIYPGCVTEKIFDCFFSGSVPVYFGAPDIKDFVPEQCFVDFRRFKKFEELWYFLENMDEAAWHRYRAEIAGFLESYRFVPFREDSVAKSWLACVKNVASTEREITSSDAALSSNESFQGKG